MAQRYNEVSQYDQALANICMDGPDEFDPLDFEPAKPAGPVKIFTRTEIEKLIQLVYPNGIPKVVKK